jgi:hypothetical protein
MAENRITYRIPDEQERREADPYAEQRAYYQLWEMRHRQRRLERERNTAGLSIYERARREGYPDWMKDD